MRCRINFLGRFSKFLNQRMVHLLHASKLPKARGAHEPKKTRFVSKDSSCPRKGRFASKIATVAIPFTKKKKKTYRVFS